MLLPVHPWTLTLKLQGLSISDEHIKSLFGSEVFAQLFNKDDIESLFKLGNKFRLQLEPHNKDLPTAVVEATLFERSEDGRGLVLGFQFHNIDKDLEEIIADQTN